MNEQLVSEKIAVNLAITWYLEHQEHSGGASAPTTHPPMRVTDDSFNPLELEAETLVAERLVAERLEVRVAPRTLGLEKFGMRVLMPHETTAKEQFRKVAQKKSERVPSCDVLEHKEHSGGASADTTKHEIEEVD